jgi:tRNA U38,U39,U40 pseudouridine synthase TruA
MKHYIEHVKDAAGQNYLAIKIDSLEIHSFMDHLRSLLGKEDFDLYTGNQQTRDKGTHHITVINVMDYSRLTKVMGMDKFVDLFGPKGAFNLLECENQVP